MPDDEAELVLEALLSFASVQDGFVPALCDYLSAAVVTVTMQAWVTQVDPRKLTQKLKQEAATGSETSRDSVAPKEHSDRED